MTAWVAGVLVRGVFLLVIGLGVLITYKSIQGKREHLKQCREYKRST